MIRSKSFDRLFEMNQRMIGSKRLNLSSLQTGATQFDDWSNIVSVTVNGDEQCWNSALDVFDGFHGVTVLNWSTKHDLAVCIWTRWIWWWRSSAELSNITWLLLDFLHWAPYRIQMWFRLRDWSDFHFFLYLGLNWRYFLCLDFSFLFAQVLWYWHSYEREIKLEDIQTPECMTPFSLMFYRITILLGILENVWWSFQDGRECNNVSVCLFTGNGLFKTEEQVILWRQASWI